MADQTLDAKGLNCPLPILRAKKALTALPAGATVMMQNMMKKKGVASIPELRALALESDVRMIACQMTMDLFEYTLDDMIPGIELGGAATYLEVATQSEINLFI